MSDDPTAALEYSVQHRELHLQALKDLIAIPTISTDSRYLDEVKRGAGWLVEYLTRLGMENVQALPTEQGHPVVFGEWLGAGEQAPTMLVYGHYDVQPADPFDQWESDPFKAEIRGDRLYGRGSSDMKGQVIAVLIALEAVQNTLGLPVNVKFLFEGQEEIGSLGLGPFIGSHGHLFQADFSLNTDAGMWALGRPAITYGLRGLVDFELRLTGPSKDLHSGLFGGVVHNPGQVMAELIAGLHNPDSTVALNGFYDRVRELPADEKRMLGELGREDSWFLKETGIPMIWGEPGFSALERTGARPTLEVNGILSGYTGEGTKTVIPSKAMAKFSMRLVPHQEPDEVKAQFEAYLEENVPPTVTWELRQFSKSHAALTDISSYYIKAMDKALTEAYGNAPVYPLGGGSIAAVPILQQKLGIESILTGYNLPDDQVHSPNESLHLPTWETGIESLIRFLEELRP